MRAILRVLAALALLGPLSTSASAIAPSRTIRVPLEDGLVATLTEERGIIVEAVPRRGEGLAAFAQRLCGDSRLAPQVAETNGGAQTLLGGVRYTVPFSLLSQAMQLKTVKALFAEDHGQADGWRHQVRGVGPLQRENLWRLAEWFTGTGENFRAIREYNELRDEDVSRGTAVTIPSELLLPAFRSVLPVPEKPFLLE